MGLRWAEKTFQVRLRLICSCKKTSCVDIKTSRMSYTCIPVQSWLIWPTDVCVCRTCRRARCVRTSWLWGWSGWKRSSFSSKDSSATWVCYSFIKRNESQLHPFSFWALITSNYMCRHGTVHISSIGPYIDKGFFLMVKCSFFPFIDKEKIHRKKHDIVSFVFIYQNKRKYD